MNTRYGRDDKIRTCDFHVPNVAHISPQSHSLLFGKRICRMTQYTALRYAQILFTSWFVVGYRCAKMPHCGFFACSQTEPHPKEKGDAFASPYGRGDKIQELSFASIFSGNR